MKRWGLWFLVLSIGAVAGLMDFRLIDEAKKAYEEERYLQSIALFKALNKKVPELAYDQGNAYYKAKQYDRALEFYEKAKGVDEAQRQHNIGNSYFQQQKFDEAINAYEKALKTREDKETRFNMELAKTQKQKKEKKKEDQKKSPQAKKDQKNKQNNSTHQEQKENETTKEQKMTQKVLNRLLKKLNQEKMPSMMYQAGEVKKPVREDVVNPW